MPLLQRWHPVMHYSFGTKLYKDEPKISCPLLIVKPWNSMWLVEARQHVLLLSTILEFLHDCKSHVPENRKSSTLTTFFNDLDE
eukprot:4338732-Amphidinium_carterae.1